MIHIGRFVRKVMFVCDAEEKGKGRFNWEGERRLFPSGWLEVS